MEPPKLNRVVRLDSIQLDETYWTNEGYLIDHPIVTSVGIFEYMNEDGSVRRELRLPENVFDPASLASYKGKPVILTHDAGVVTKKNVDREHIGTILTEGYQDGSDVRCEIVVHSTDEMKHSGLRELSLGYSLDLDETPGTWEGQPYDAIQKNIRINHLALVDKARAGEQARLNIDGRAAEQTKGGKKAMAKTKKTTRNDGPMSSEELAQAIEEYKARRAARGQTDEGTTEDPVADNAPAPDTTPTAPVAVGGNNEDDEDKVQIVKDRRDRRDSEGDPETTEDAMGVIAQQDEDIDALLEVIEAMEAKQEFDAASAEGGNNEDDDDENTDEDDENTDEDKGGINADAADRLFRDRLEVVRIGDRLKLDGLDTMSVTNARKAIIKAVTPSLRLDGKGPVYVKAAFELAKETLNSRKGTDFQRGQMTNKVGNRADASNKAPSAKSAREKMIRRMDENGGKK